MSKVWENIREFYVFYIWATLLGYAIGLIIVEGIS